MIICCLFAIVAFVVVLCLSGSWLFLLLFLLLLILEYKCYHCCHCWSCCAWCCCSCCSCSCFCCSCYCFCCYCSCSCSTTMFCQKNTPHRRSIGQCDLKKKATGARSQKVTKATKAKQAESHTNWKTHKSNNPFPSAGQKKDSKLYLPYTYHGEGKSEGCLRRHVAVRAVVTLIDIQKDCLRSDSNAQGDIRDMSRLMLDEVITFLQIIVGYERHAKSLHVFST